MLRWVGKTQMKVYKMHMVHLEKLAQVGGGEFWSHDPETKGAEGKAVERIEKSFCCYGYYNKMTYIAEDPGNKSSYFTYEHAFSIKYPYKKAKKPINADQLFVLLEPRSGQEANRQGDNPFTEGGKNKPFLGVYLLNIGMIQERGEEAERQRFLSALEHMRDRIREKLKEECAKNGDSVEVFLSPNCADLCVVLRTDSLGRIYKVKKNVGGYMAKDESEEKPDIHITLYIASELEGQGKDLLDEKLVQENGRHDIEIRLNCSHTAFDWLQGCLREGSHRLMGSTGRGKYILTLPYSDFARFYSLYAGVKWGEGGLPGKVSLMADEDAPSVEGTRRQAGEHVLSLDESIGELFEKYGSEIKVIYDRWFIHLTPGECENDNALGDDTWEERKRVCEAMEKSVDDLASLSSQMASEEGNDISFSRQRFIEQYQLIKDLLYTYNNLWHDENSVPEARIFYTQISALVEGTRQQLRVIQKALEEKKESAGNRWTKISPRTINRLNEDLIQNMNIMISGINDFNKLIQAVNQNQRNVPNYEMLSKVNVKKYLYAYTMYLVELCRRYYGGNKYTAETGRIFPMVTISQVDKKINAPTLFQSLIESDEPNGGLRVFLVRCPSYQRFANVYHVLPMISHEISHCFCYISREKRNQFVLRYLSQKMAEVATDQLFNLNDHSYRTYSKECSMKFVYHIVWKELESALTKALGFKLPHLHLNNMEKVCVTEMRGCFGIAGRREIVESRLWENSEKNFIKLFELCHITYVVPEDVARSKGECGWDALPNLIIDILKKKDVQIEQWENILEDADLCKALDKDVYLKNLPRIVADYRSQNGIARETVVLGLEVILARMWKGFLAGNAKRVEKVGENQELRNYLMGISDRILNDTDNGFVLKPIELKGIQDILELDEEECFRMQQYVLEVAGLVREVLKHWEDVSWKKYLHVPCNTSGDCAEKIHRRLNDEYNKAVEDLDRHGWIVTKRTQVLYASLGITRRSPSQFSQCLKKAVSVMDDSYLEALLQDKMTLYKEVFADLGMCKIFGFTTFGYYAYIIHLFMKEREVPLEGAYDLSEERIKMVIYTLWLEQGRLEKNLKPMEEREYFLTKSLELKNLILEYQEKIDSLEQNLQHSRELQMHGRMLHWMKEIYLDMQPGYFVEELDPLLQYLNKIYGEDMGFLEGDRDPVVKEIGSYYNNFINNVNNPEADKRIMNVQNNFVLEYYGRMQDSCAGINVPELLAEFEGFDFAAQYNCQFMQWQGVSE